MFCDEWLFGQWDEEFMNDNQPSIAYLKLFALTAAVLAWSHKLCNIRMAVHCHNQSVVHMVNSSSSKCPNCMYLIRLLTLSGMTHNWHVYARYIDTKANFLADSLSRLDFK